MKSILLDKQSRARNLLAIYAMLQTVILIFLRKFYLLTVYQTAVAYLAVSIIGIVFFSFKNGAFVNQCRNIYAIFWSAFHGIIILGFLTKGTFYLTLTQLNIIQIINIFLGIALYWFVYMLSGQRKTAIGLGNIVIGIMGIANHYLVRFRGAPFQTADIKAARTAGNVVQNYDFTPDIFMVVSIIDLVLWYLLMRQTESAEQFRAAEPEMKDIAVNRRHRKAETRRGILEWGFTALIAAGCIALVIGPYSDLYNRTGTFSRDNYLADLLADIKGSIKRYPEYYSAEAACEILSAIPEDSAAPAPPDSAPDIIVIMNEAFADLRVLGEIPVDTPVMEYWDSLSQNCIKGWANVSVLGGTTANSEYEYLTSDAVSLYGNYSGIPYNNYFQSNDTYPGLVSLLREQGYETTAFHPYLSSGWNRTQVYRAMQFEHIIFSEDLKEPLDKLRIYVSDKGDYDFIENWFRQRDLTKPQFFFNITMQNHGGYTYDEDNFDTTVHLTGDTAGRFPQAEQYLSLIKASDAALKDLLAYFENYERPVIIVVFGDHQPNLEPEFYTAVTGQPKESWDLEQKSRLYKTPFLIWHNYDTEYQELGDVSINYLAPLLLQDAGLPLSRYHKYLLEKMDELPVINQIGVRDAAGTLYPWGNAAFEELLANMRILVYNHTVDRDNRAEGF